MNKFSVITSIFMIFAATFSVSAQMAKCNCRTASEDEIPLGGNELIVENAGTVKEIRGETSFGLSGEVFEDVVVEVFAIGKSEDKDLSDSAWKVIENKKRKFACVTGKKGKFCFKNLPKGTYVLRVGTRTRAVEYFNYVHIIVKLDPGSGKNKVIKVGLEVAT